jgi:hypothetical protein
MKGTFNDGTTESWVKYLANTIENDNNALKITYVDDDRGAYVFLSNTHDLNTDLTIGDEYKVVGLVKVNTGSVTLEANVQSGGTIDTINITSTDWIEFELNFTAGNATTCLLRLDNLSAGEIIWIDRYELFHKTTQTGNNLVDNGGARNAIGALITTDWNDSNSDGLADGWTKHASAIPSIVTGNGFSGNAQRIDAGASSQHLDISNVLIAGYTNRITFKYRADQSFRLYTNVQAEAIDLNIAINTGDAIEYTIDFDVVTGTNLRFYATAAQYIEIDEVETRVFIDGEFYEPEALGADPVIILTDYFAENPGRYLTRYFNAQNWKDLLLLSVDHTLTYEDHLKLLQYVKEND